MRLPAMSLALATLATLASCHPLDAFTLPCPGGDCSAHPGDGSTDTGDGVGDGSDAGDDADPGPPGPPEGCSDLTREGFLSIPAFPDIAACSGGFSVAGVLRPDLVPTCERVAGNHSSNPDGAGCSAADLCARRWHLCRGAPEVAAKAAGGCTQAVPIGTPDQSLFFAVAQHSENSLACNDTTGDNDVFGCGNLGVALVAGTCSPLNRALAGTSSGSCGWNQAEPPMGPWQCTGTGDSHLHEGAIITKFGCPSQSCSWNSSAIGNADKGGVLCCRD